MIIGIGQDICDVERIESTIIKFGERFKKRIYSEREINKSESRRNSIDSYARRFAAKEAVSKALGTGFRKGVFYKDIEVINLKSGKPTIELKGGALDQFRLITSNNKNASIEISLTDDKKLALAIVIISD
ncbi:MAG: holo-ACP synthase [Pelagibacterales bacterium]|jgi:holo-[acyl-carrier protein] synthase|nr:holo-ACP synthase [Pelagibacterales bacterium]MBT4109008.1 holo-ACP synthase [Pelagibacterales bacterium]MDG2268373.1 holo-ACP synthase [Alphaproteobacteria bacterium]